MSSYAVVWQDELAPGGTAVFAGKLELEESRLRLEGVSRDGRQCRRTVGYDELGAVHMAPSGERLVGRPTLVVERPHGLPLRLGTIDGRGALPELADQLSHRVLDLMRLHRIAS